MALYIIHKIWLWRDNLWFVYFDVKNYWKYVKIQQKLACPTEQTKIRTEQSEQIWAMANFELVQIRPSEHTKHKQAKFRIEKYTNSMNLCWSSLTHDEFAAEFIRKTIAARVQCWAARAVGRLRWVRGRYLKIVQLNYLQLLLAAHDHAGYSQEKSLFVPTSGVPRLHRS